MRRHLQMIARTLDVAVASVHKEEMVAVVVEVLERLPAVVKRFDQEHHRHH